MNDSWDDLNVEELRESNSPRNVRTNYFSDQAASSCDINDSSQRSATPSSEKYADKYKRTNNQITKDNSSNPSSNYLLETATNLKLPKTESSSGVYIGTTYGSQDRTKRVFGQNFKYMKHYVRERRNSLTRPDTDTNVNQVHSTESNMRRRNSEGNVELRQPQFEDEKHLLQNSQDFTNERGRRSNSFTRQDSRDQSHYETSKQTSFLKFETGRKDENKLTYSREEKQNISPRMVQKHVPTTRSTISKTEDGLHNTEIENTRRLSHRSDIDHSSDNMKTQNEELSDRTFRPNFMRQLLNRDNDENLRLDKLFDHSSGMTGQNFVKISKHKLQKMQETNDMALKRKDDLQRELLDSLKKISQLEISQTHSYTEKRELMVELRIVKERLADAEREAASSIGKASKLEQELKEANSNSSRYLEDLKKTENKLTVLEDDFCQTKASYLYECTKKEDEGNRVEKLELQLDSVKEENLKLKTFLSIKEKDFEEACHEIENLHRDKKMAHREKISIVHDKENIEEIYNKTLHKSKNNEKTIEQLQANLKDQKVKFDIIIKSRINLENELNKMHEELSKEKVEKQQIIIDMKKCENENSQFKNVLIELKDRNDELKYENQDLKNRLIEIGLYREILEENRQNKYFNKTRETDVHNEEQNDDRQSKRVYNNANITNRRSNDDRQNNDAFMYRKKYPSSLKSNTNEQIHSSNYQFRRNENDNQKSSDATQNSDNMLKNGESILKSSRNNKMQWDRSALDIQKQSYLFDESLEAEDYEGSEIENMGRQNVNYNEDMERQNSNNYNEDMERQNSNNYQQRKPVGVTFAADVETFDDSENNFSEMLNKGNQDLVDAFMQ